MRKSYNGTIHECYEVFKQILETTPPQNNNDTAIYIYIYIYIYGERGSEISVLIEQHDDDGDDDDLP